MHIRGLGAWVGLYSLVSRVSIRLSTGSLPQKSRGDCGVFRKAGVLGVVWLVLRFRAISRLMKNPRQGNAWFRLYRFRV